MAAKTLLISGSSRGLGFYMAHYFFGLGWNVILNGRDPIELQKAADCVGTPYFIAGDMRNEFETNRVASQIQNWFGRLDALVCNAGVSSPSDSFNSQAYVKAFDENFLVSIQCLFGLMPQLENGRGTVVFITSICGLGNFGCPVPYAVAKSSLNRFVIDIAPSLAERNVRINAIAPGNLMFPGSVWEKKYAEDQEGVDRLIHERVPLKTFGTPDDVSSLVRYLVTEESKFVTGSIFKVDGGQAATC